MHPRVPLISLRAAIILNRDPFACHRHVLLKQALGCRIRFISDHGGLYHDLAIRTLSSNRHENTIQGTRVNALTCYAIPNRRFHRGSVLNENESSKVEVTVKA